MPLFPIACRQGTPQKGNLEHPVIDVKHGRDAKLARVVQLKTVPTRDHSVTVNSGSALAVVDPAWPMTTQVHLKDARTETARTVS